MLTMLSNWKGAVEINGVNYETVTDALKNVDTSVLSKVDIRLHSSVKRAENALKTSIESVSDVQQYRITVKQYMTKKGSRDFDFMIKWNNDNPMPFRTMIGTVEKETRGMVYMNLHADIWAKTIPVCMKCGRPLTNKISQYFGIGPECGGHNYVNPFNSEEELDKAVQSYREELRKVTWSGWIIKSAITEREEV